MDGMWPGGFSINVDNLYCGLEEAKELADE
jgi:hypothetical protein